MNKTYYTKNIFSKFIKIEGIDKSNFLQSIITNDINKCLDNKEIIYSCILTPQGKFIADFFIINIKNYYLIEIHEKYFDSFYNKLKMYKLRSNIQMHEIANMNSFILYDEKLRNNFKFFYKDPRNNNIGFKIYAEKNETNILTKLSELNFTKYKELLIKNLIPNSVDDLIINKSLLLENNFQNINAIDWNKGCYVGQEITARMKYRSLLKKKIYNLEIIEGEIQIGSNIYLNKSVIGVAISKVNQYLLCMLKIDSVENLKKNKLKLKADSNITLKFL